jgi:hypothetical protein
MMGIIILTRRLKKGKTYEDFRKAWFHTVGYGAPVRLYSAINAFDQREIIVVGLAEIELGQDPTQLIQIEVKERMEHPLDAVIEPEMGRTLGLVVSEDDFSQPGRIEYRPASINGKKTDFKEIAQGLDMAREMFTRAMEERDAAKKRRLERPQ